MKLLAIVLTAAALALSGAARADSPATLGEGFDDITALSGWVMTNESMPTPGTGWFQGNPGIFPSLSGGPDSYIGASYLASANPAGAIDLWLMTPVLDISLLTQISYSLRAATEPGYSDMVQLLYSPGAGTDPDTFILISQHNPVPGSWTTYTGAASFEGEGRFAFRYLGAASQSNFIGIDSVMITQVPEPAPYVMLCVGLAALLGFRRSRAMVAYGTIAISSAAFAGEPPQQSGMVVVRDPQSGQLRAPTATEYRALNVLASSLQAGQPAPPPRTIVRPDGTVQRSVGPETMSYTVVSRGKDGKLAIECVTGQPSTQQPRAPRESGHELE